MTRRYQAHREPQTVGDWIDYIAAHRWAVARDFAALVFLTGAILAILYAAGGPS